MDLGPLFLRLIVGALFVGHGTQKLFGWFGGPGQGGTTEFMRSLGYRPGRAHARLAGITETVSGGLLLLGLIVPFAAAGIIGVAVNAIGSVHARNGVWNSNGGYEFPLVMLTAAGALAFTGGGALALGPALDGMAWGFTALALGLVSGFVLLSTREVPAREHAPAAAEAEESGPAEQRGEDDRDEREAA